MKHKFQFSFKIFFSVNISFLLRNGFFYFTYEFLPFQTWCPLKGQTYLNKAAAESCRFV